ncbi:MAG: patatin-like phospholipase family protein [Anaerolineaceae bacterium]|nr:patatin-like phospholipase family protein [Anaerolineaceae bacterium]MBN2676804.1 patatin-like phospholipase family protein [Anaerolineaceae bacterium]
MTSGHRPTQKIGLALSGGGARGLAHIGVYKVLDDAGIPIDYISGTSMGAIIGACIARGIRPAEINAIAQKFSKTRQLIRMVDLAGGRRGLLSGKHVRAFLADILGVDTDFKQLQIPLSVCSVDLDQGIEKVFTKGNVLDAVMASIAVPGIFVPQVVNNHQLVDGGVKNNLPVDHVREMGAEFILAVDVMRHDFSKMTTGNRMESITITPTASFQEIYRYVAMMISEQTRLRLLLEPPDFVIEPDLPNDLLSFGGFSQADQAIMAGESAARQSLPDILTALKMTE